MSKHLQKIEKIYSHPLPANLDVKKTLKALEHYGVRTEVTKNHRVKLFFEEKEAVVQLPHGDHFTKDEVMALKHFLQECGLTPEAIKNSAS